MILAPKVEGGSDINEEQLNQAVAIIRQRVDGSGVAEAEISTQSGRNVVVSLPGTPSKETRALIQASADMNFRPVLQAGAGAAVPAESRTPDDQLPKPTAEPANSSDINWITPEVYKQFEALDCDNPSQDKQERSDPAKPLVTCEPATANSPAIKYILGPVEVKGSNIKCFLLPAAAGRPGRGDQRVGRQHPVRRRRHRQVQGSHRAAVPVLRRRRRRDRLRPEGPVRHRPGRPGHLGPAVPRRHHRRPSADHRRVHRGSPRRPSPTSCASAPCRSASKSRANSRSRQPSAASSSGWACSPA